MPPTLEERLKRFAEQHHMKGKGALCVALVMSRIARERGLPLDPDTLLTKGGGQEGGGGEMSDDMKCPRCGTEGCPARAGWYAYPHDKVLRDIACSLRALGVLLNGLTRADKDGNPASLTVDIRS
jgi:hypothetical protein